MATTKHTRLATAHLAPFGVRMQPDLKARLEAEAEKAGRSLNSEIVSRLEESLHAGSTGTRAVDQGAAAYELIAERTVAKLLESERFLESIARLRERAIDGMHELAPMPSAEHAEPAPDVSSKRTRRSPKGNF